MMIPITRKEKYINEIVGGGDTAPETPQTREEFFFAEILGEVIAPSPVTRVEKYLSAIAGQYGGDLPTPITRIEYFLARAAGMDVTIPTPITREEIFWSSYSAIVDFEVEGVPPLTYKAIEGTLENYRIYGNTVGGESVGDLIENGEHAGEYKIPVTVSNGTDTLTTPIYLPEQIKKVGDEAEYIDYAEQKQHRVRKNLFDKSHFIQSNLVFRLDSTYIVADPYTVSTILPCKPNTKYTITKIITNRFIIWGCENYPVAGENGNGHIVQDDNAASLTFTTGSNDNFLLVMLFYQRQPSDPTVEDVKNNLMYNYGEMCPYEPYIENTDLDVTLPALPTLTGTNVLSVGTAVQPSKVYVKYKGERQ